MKVLLIQDDLGALETARRILEARGHSVVATHSATSGIEIATAQEPDVVVLHLILPDLDGLEVAQVLRGAGSRSQIFVVTGFASVRTVEVLRDGVEDGVLKPINAAEVLGLVERTKSGRQGAASAVRADGLVRWALAVASVLDASVDVKTVDTWASARAISPETLRSWCRTAGLPVKGSLDLGRVLRAAYRANLQDAPVERFLNAADLRTIERLCKHAGIRDGERPTLREVASRQTFVRDPVAIDELLLTLQEFGFPCD